MTVHLGCFEATELLVDLVHPLHPKVLSLTNNTLKLQTKEPAANMTMDLNTVVTWKTNQPHCGAFKLTLFSNADLMNLTTAFDSIHLAANPTTLNLKTGALPATLQISYNNSTKFPLRAYLRAETNSQIEQPQTANVVIEVIQMCQIEDNSQFTLDQTFNESSKVKIIDLLPQRLFKPADCLLKFGLALKSDPKAPTDLVPFVHMDQNRFLTIEFPAMFQSNQTVIEFFLLAWTSPSSTVSKLVTLTKVHQNPDLNKPYCQKQLLFVNRDPLEIPADSTNVTTIHVSDYSSWFLNTDPVNCPVIDFKLKGSNSSLKSSKSILNETITMNDKLAISIQPDAIKDNNSLLFAIEAQTIAKSATKTVAVRWSQEYQRFN